MNNIFKTIWNKSTQSWVAVSELARGYVKSSSDKTSCRIAKIGSSKFNLSFITLSILISASPEIVASNHATTYGVISGGNHNIAIGTNSKTGDTGKQTNQSIAIGSGNGANDGARAKGDQSIAIGGNTIAEGHSSIAIGGDDVDKAINERINYTNNDGNSISGKLGEAYTSLTGGDLLKPSRYTSSKSGHLGVALGVKAVASNLSLALGTNAQASKTNTLAIGAGAIAELDNSVAIGGGASTEGSSGTKQQNTTIEGTLFSWAGGDNVLKGDIVTFGKKGFERQLKNIAPGEVSATSTDAINGSQLHSITQVLTKRSQRDVYVHVNTGETTQAEGSSATNAGQIDAKGGATGTKSATLGVNATATAENAIAIGTGASASKQNSVALGSGAQTIEVSTDNSTKFFTTNNASGASTNSANFAGLANSTNGSVSFGSVGKERQLHNVAAGRITATSTDAINGSQLYHIATNLGFNVYQGDSSKARINNDSVVKFVDGNYTSAVVTPENGNAKVTFNVKTSKIDANTITVTGNDTGGLAKASDVVNAIKATGFTVETNGTNNGTDNKIVHNDVLNINQENGINIVRDNTTFLIGLNQATRDILDKVGTGAVALNDNKTVTGGAVKVAINDEVNKLNKIIDELNFHFEGDVNTEKGKILLKTGSMKIKGEVDGPISTETSTNSDTLTLKIKDASINTKHLANNAVNSEKIQNDAVTTDKIADGNVTFEKLNETVKNKISEKEESVEATDKANELGLLVTSKDRTAENKGKLFTIDLKSETLISKLSENAQIGGIATNKLVTDTQLNTYLNSNPLKFEGNLGDAISRKLGETLSIIGKDGVKDLTFYTDGNIATDTSSGKVIIKFKDTPEFKGTKFKNDNNEVTVTPTSDGLSFTKNGADTAVKLGNLANATINANSKDAVTGSQLHATNERITSLESGWQIAGNDLQKVQDIKKGTNKVNFVNSKNIEATVTAIGNGASVHFTAKTQDIVIDNKTGVIISPTDDNNLITAKSVADALGKVGWVATSDKVDNGEVIGKSTEKVSSGDTVTFQAGKNLKIKQEGKKFTYSTLDDVNFTKITATDSIKITNGPTLSTTGLDMAEKKITNLADGDITDTSEDAITGKQLKDLADKLGIIPNTTTNNKFDAPVFPNSLKKADQSNENAPKSLLDAINKNIEVINRGLVFGGDVGTPTTQYLGSKFDIKAAAINDTIDNKFVGKNLKTKYVNSNGDGLLSIGLSETPDFKSITLSEGGNPYLTLGKDANENSGKITGLTNRNATNNTDYGTNGNDSRAATEGAVKEISDRIKQSDNTSPFTYVDENGNPVTKAADGKFYPKNLVNADGTPKAEANGKGIDPSNVVIKTKNDTPLPITNVRSGLGLDGKAEDNAVEGTSSNPKAIGADKAQKIIAGNNKDGNGGLLTKEGADLNKVATIGDLQALAQAGLDFSGNLGQHVHRPLGTKLEILGKEGINNSAGYSGDNLVTETANSKLYIKFKEKPEFKGITVKDGADKQQIELSPDKGLVLKKDDNDNSPVTITATGIDAGDSKITNLGDGQIANGSKEAVTGNQLKTLADKLGVDVDATTNTFANPVFKDKIKDASGSDTGVTAPTTFKDAIENVISAVNRGLDFGGDEGQSATQYLGSKFDVKAATSNITHDNKTFVGKNLRTSYTKGQDGNGVLSIGLIETPDFKTITLSDGGNNSTPYLTLGKDGTNNSGVITGLTDRNATKNATDYGKDDNAGRAATEGAVKELSDRVNQGDKNSPFVYEKADGTKIKKAADGKFYPESLVNADGTTKDGASAQEVKPEDVVVKVNDNTPMPITNVKSGLGLDGKSDTDPTTGSQSEPKAISADKAKTAIAGKDGKSGLLSKEGADLNKVSTIGDLQALAQAGLDFAGNKGTVIHRPLGTKLEILGNASIKDDELAKFSTDNIVTETKDDKLYIKFKDIPKLKGLELNSGNSNAKSITISPDDTGSKLTLSGGDNSDVQLDGLQKGQITDTSKNAVTGNQLKDLADKLGVDVNDEKTGFKMPEFTAIKGKDGKDAADTDKPKNLRDAVNKTIEAVNRGLTFTGDSGTGTQNLGSTFNVKSVDDGKEIDVKGKKFVGKNITTKYEKDANGNGTLSIGISEKPDFEAVTLTKKGETTPFLTIGEDTDNTDKPTTGKITGLTARDLGSKGYGVGDNVGRAATEGAVKDLYDKVKSNEGSSPFEYRDEAGNKLVKVGDKYYSEKDLAGKHIVDGKIFNDPVVKKDDKYYVAGPDGKPKLGTDGQPIMTEATTATIKDKAPATASNKQLTDISNVRSGLGLDGKSETNSVDGSPAEPKAISVEKAKEVIAGKDGKSGLLTTEGAPLNKVATIGDLQAVAKSGLTFKGNNTDAEVHRPLGTTLDIKGEATESTGTSGKNVYVHADSTNNSLTVKIKETPEFKGLELKDQNTNAIKFAPSEVEDKTDPNKKNAVLTLSSGTGPNNTVKLTGISDGDISPTSKDAVNGSQVFALSRGEVPKTEDKHITITQPDGSTTVIDAKNVIVDDKGNPLLKTYNVQGQGEHIENSIISAISNMNTEGIKFFHTNDGRKQNERPQEQGLNEQDSSAGGVHSTAVGYRANAAGENGVAFGPDAVAGKILAEKEVTITERVNGKEVVTKRKVRVVEGVKNAIAIGAGARASNDNTISIGSGNQVNGKNSGAIGDPSYIDADNAYAIGNNNKIDTTSEKTFVLGNDVTVTTARSVFLGDAVGYVAADNKAGTTKGNAEYSEQKIGETTYKYAGGKTNEVVGVVSVGNVKQDGTMETRRIQNVAPGLISDKSTDAINGSQLYAVMDSGWNLKAEEVDGTSGKVTKGKADTTKVSIGKTVKVRAGNNVEIAHNKDESIDISTSMAPTFNSLNVNPGGTVNMGGNRVQNVGNAVEAGDAVNYGQFKAEVGKLDSRLQAGIAGAVASGTLVQAFNPNESLVAVGAGTYRGKSAVALGYSRVSDNGKIIIKVTGSTNTYGDVTGGASVGYKF